MPSRDQDPRGPDRRNFLFAGLGLAAVVVSSRIPGARAEQTRAKAGKPAQRQASKPMRIATIGAGSLGGTVGRLWVQAGHEVMFSSRHPDELVAITRELGARASAGTPQQAAEFACPGEVVCRRADGHRRLGRSRARA
jgi:hypothetical protein